MRGAGAVIHLRRPEAIEGGAHAGPVEQIDRLPHHAGHVARRRSPGPMPRDEVSGQRRVAIAAQEIQQMAACEARCAGDENRPCHAGHYLALPELAPVNGEKLPSPASVKVMKNRLSTG